MEHHITLTTTTDVHFKEAWQLYGLSFPKEERRTLAVQEKIMGFKAYNFDVLISEDKFVGFLLWWEFNDLVFVEHFAVNPLLRGQGYGEKILQRFISTEKRPVILEVELPEPGIKLRRIEFYKRLGFILNTHHYVQPPMQKSCEALPLYLMSYPNEFDEDSIAHFVDDYHPLIYNQELL